MIRRILLAIAAAVVPLVAAAQAEDLTTPIIWVEFDVDPTPTSYSGQTFDYPELCIQLPEVSNRNTGAISGPGRLMRRDATGTVTTLYECNGTDNICMPTDPRLSPDGTKVAFTIYRGTTLTGACGSTGNRTLTGTRGANIGIHDLTTGITTEWPYVANVFDVTPVWINQGGTLKVMFSSDRVREYEPIAAFGVSPLQLPALQTYYADPDGSNVVRVGVHDNVSNYGGFQLKDGRIVSSCAQWTHDLTFIEFKSKVNFPGTTLNMWWMCAQDPWGGSIESPLGAHLRTKALHWFSQMSDNRIAIGEYYRGNSNQGAGNIILMQPNTGFTVEGRPVSEAVFKYDSALIPRSFQYLTDWANSDDAKSYFDSAANKYKPKLRDPFGLPSAELGVVACFGTCNRQFGLNPDGLDYFVASGPATSTPVVIADPIGAELGIYKLPADKIPSTNYNDLVKLRDQRHVAEFGAIYGGPYVNVYGQAQPDTVTQPLSGNSNCYLHIASQQSDTTSYDEFHNQYKWGYRELAPLHGKQAIGVQDSDVKFIRISKILPNTSKQTQFGLVSPQWWTVWGHKAQSLGDAPVQPDGSAKIQIPCETPFLLQGLNAERSVVKRDMMIQSMRTGTVLTCGGCHLHNDVSPQPDFAASQAASLPATPLLTPVAQPEYAADVVPVLNRNCAACHNASFPAAGIRFEDLTDTDGDGLTTFSMLLYDNEQRSNPNPLVVRPAEDGWTATNNTSLDRPWISWLVNGSYSVESPLFWYFSNARKDYRTNGTYADDYDFNTAHPTLSISATDVTTIKTWIDMGLYADPTVAKAAWVPTYTPADDNYALPSGGSINQGE